MLRFWIVWTGFFAVLGVFWTVERALEGNVTAFLFQLFCTCIQVYGFIKYRREWEDQNTEAHEYRD